jgi:hypothetical protein
MTIIEKKIKQNNYTLRYFLKSILDMVTDRPIKLSVITSITF